MITERYRIRLRGLCIDYKLNMTFLCILLTVINSLVVRSEVYGIIIGITEMFFLTYTLLCRGISEFTTLLILLLTLSLDNVSFAMGNQAATMYSLYNLPVLKAYLLLFIIGCAFLKVFLRKTTLRKIHIINSKMELFYTINFICIFIGLIMTFLTLLLNDNNVLVHTELWRYIVRDIYQIIYVLSIGSLVVYCLKDDEEFERKIETLLIAILTGVTWGATILICIGNCYNTWGSEYYIACPLILFFSPGLILFYNKKMGGFNFITGIVSILIQLKFTVGIAGTWWVYLAGVLFVFIRSLFSDKDKRSIFLFKFLCIILTCLIIVMVVNFGFAGEIQGQISYKLQTFKNIFATKGNILDWYIGLGGSIQTRIEEVVNAIIELLDKPYYLLFGKGYGGTVIKHWGYSNWNISGSTFADVQINYQTYSSFHTAIAEIIINFGIMGILMIVFVLKNCIAEIVKKNGNMWVVIGTLWFVFFYSLYYCFNVGIVWLCVGLYMSTRKKNE